MAISKSKREAVYRKYKGHCAYCGREIAYKDMQVDHFQPLRAWGIEDAGTDDLDNLMPACRMCNHYKRANSLETFRALHRRNSAKAARELYLARSAWFMAKSSRPKNRLSFTLRRRKGKWRTMAEYIERTEELVLALNAGARAIENTRRYHGAVYTKDVFSEDSQEIPYLLAAKVLREVRRSHR